MVAMLLSATVGAEDRGAARRAFSEGVGEYDLNHFAEALQSFERAYRNFESPSFLYNIARCHQALGQNGEAVTMYKRYLASGQVDPGERVKIEAVIHDLEAQIDRPAVTTRPERRPRRAWIWGVVGGVVVVGVVLGVGIGLGTEAHPPNASDGSLHF
jgi:tetratricopeptide (TPR) repeat protein